MTLRLRSRGMATLVRAALEAQAENYPTKAALLVRSASKGAEPHRWSAAGVLDHSGAVANGLLELAKTGDVVAAAFGNSAERAAMQIGAATAGMRLLDSGLGLTKEGVAAMLKQNNVRILAVHPSQMEAVYAAIPSLKEMPQDSSAALQLAEYPHLRYILQSGNTPMRGTHRFRDTLVYNAVIDKIASVSNEDRPFLAVIDPSSGKVSSELSQKQALQASLDKAKSLKIAADSRVVYKANGGASFAQAVLGCVLNSSLLVVPAEAHDDKAIAQAEEKDECKIGFA